MADTVIDISVEDEDISLELIEETLHSYRLQFDGTALVISHSQLQTLFETLKPWFMEEE